MRSKTFTPLAIPMTEVYQQLLSSGNITPILARFSGDPLPTNLRTDLQCIYHSNQLGHDLEACRSFKYKVQDLIDSGVINLEDAKLTPNVTANPLPNHPGVNMISVERQSSPQQGHELICGGSSPISS